MTCNAIRTEPSPPAKRVCYTFRYFGAFLASHQKRWQDIFYLQTTQMSFDKSSVNISSWYALYLRYFLQLKYSRSTKYNFNCSNLTRKCVIWNSVWDENIFAKEMCYLSKSKLIFGSWFKIIYRLLKTSIAYLS